MKEKFTDKNIDLTFREAIDPIETEPSEKFWTEASDSILDRANMSYGRTVRIWKMTSFALAAILVCLVFYASYTGNKINSIQKQLTLLEKQRVSGMSKEKLNEKIGAVSAKGGISPAIAIVNSSHTSENKPNTLLNQNTQQNNTEKTPGELKNQVNANTPPQGNANNTIVANGENAGNANAPSIADVKGNSSTAPSSTSPEPMDNSKSTLPASAQSVSANEDLPVYSQMEPIQSKTVSSIFFGAPGDAKIENTNSSLLRILYPLPNPVSGAARFSIGIFMAPSMTGEFHSGQNGDLYSNSATGGEKARVAFDAGVNIDYDISHKWVIESGLGYHTYSFSMQPTLVWAKPTSQGELAYSIITSCGVLQLPYHDSQLKPGDNVHANGHAYCGYLSIPLQIKYNLATSKHFGIYVTGGAIANFTMLKGAVIHWENSTDQDDESIHTIQGLSKTQYSYTVGAGLKYFLGKGFSIFGEPFMNGSATPIDKNAPVISYPYFIGIRAGLFYSL